MYGSHYTTHSLRSIPHYFTRMYDVELAWVNREARKEEEEVRKKQNDNRKEGRKI